MAGDWIKMRGNLWDDPRVTRLADETDQPEAMIVGGLYWLWATADQHSSDGALEGMTLRAIDRKTGIKGFGDALVLIGWLVEEASGTRVVRFEEHNGASAKSRSDTARRVANHRTKKSGDIETAESKSIPRPVRAAVLARDNATCVYCSRKEGQLAPNEVATDGYMCLDHVIPFAQGGSNDPSNLVCACAVCNRFKGNRTPDECGLPWPLDETGMKRGSNAKHVTGALPREEKRREEKKEPKSKANPAPAAPTFDARSELIALGVEPQTAADWLALRKTKRATVTPTVLKTLVTEAGKAALSLEAVLSICCSRGWAGFEADWVLKDQRAGPQAAYQTSNDKAKAWADSLTGRNRNHEPDHRIIDINDAPARKLG